MYDVWSLPYLVRCLAFLFVSPADRRLRVTALPQYPLSRWPSSVATISGKTLSKLLLRRPQCLSKIRQKPLCFGFWQADIWGRKLPLSGLKVMQMMSCCSAESSPSIWQVVADK